VSRILLLVCAISTLCLPASGEWVDIGGAYAEAPRVTVLEDGPDGTTIEFELAGYDLRQVEVEGSIYSVISLPEANTYLHEGLPQLPRLTESIIVPDNAHIAYEILAAESQVRTIAPVLSSKGNLPRSVNPETIPYTFSKFYEKDEWFPEKPFELYDPFILREFRGVNIRFNPFQYNPVTRSLRVWTRLVVRVYADGKPGDNVKIRPRTALTEHFIPIYRDIFLNYSTGRYPLISEVGNLLIIVYDNFYDATLPYYEWKMMKGIPSKIVRKSEAGSTADQIYNYIQDEYQTHGVTFIVLVGDAEQIPYKKGTAGWALNEPADPTYGCLEGGDWYPDAFVSRISASNVTDVEKQVERFIQYERYPASGASWYHKGTGIASDEGRPSDKERCDWLRADLLDYTYTQVDQIYDPGAGVSEVRNALNDGRSIVNYIGHGWNEGWVTTGFDISDVNTLSNTDILPFIISVACYGGYFPGCTCFGEAWLRAGTASDPKGAIAFYGSSISQSWVPPCVGQAAAVDILCADQMNTLGGILFNGSCQMIEEYYPDSDGAEIFQTWHIFGDASLQVRTDTPASIWVDHPSQVGVGQPFAVMVTDAGGGVYKALVGLWKEDMQVSGYTDMSGEVTLMIPGDVSSGTMSVTVTAYNHENYEGVATVTTGPYPVTITITPHQTVVKRGEDLLFDAMLVNSSGDPQTFDCWTAAERVGGGVYEPVLGPKSLTLNPYQTKEFNNLKQPIPNNAPLGDYIYYGRIGDYPEVYHEDSFEFEVIP
jgi:hypothetical protein